MGRGYGMIVAICSVMAVLAECKYAPLDGLKSPAPYSQESAASFSHERRAALATDAWGGMRVDWSAVADWPTGDSPAAKAARRWIKQQSLPSHQRTGEGEIQEER